MARRLENMFLAGVSVKMGRSKGRQAPTMPSDDSTMGQYTVGVSRSFWWSARCGVLGCDGRRTCEIFVSCSGVWRFVVVSIL